MKPIFRHIPKILLNSQKPYRQEAKRAYKSVITELEENTLTGRLLAYIKPNVPNVPATDTPDVLQHTKQLRRYNLNQVIGTFNTLATISNKMEYLTLLNMLDKECSRRISTLRSHEILQLLHIYMKTMPNKIVQHKFYTAAIKELLRRINTLTKHDLVQLIFYIGLMKKFAESHALRKCIGKLDEEAINSLTAEELCVICNATFKTGTRLDNDLFLDKVVTYLNDNLYLLKDPGLFITLLKTVRLNRYQNEDLLSTITCAMFFNKTLEYYSFIGLCHILALYSDFLYYEETVLDAFTEKCIQILKENEFVSMHCYTPDQPRLKDIKRLMWCLSNLNYQNLNLDDVEKVIVPNILNRVQDGEVEGDPTSLIEIMLYLWMLNYRAYELVPYALSKTNLEALNVSDSPAKHRLNLLISCIYHEDVARLKDLNLHPDLTVSYETKYQLEKRPLLTRIVENVKKLSKGQEINRFDVCCQIPGLNIIGITGYKKNIYKAVHIEVLDEYTSLKNTDEVPTGLMQLKLRILDASEEGVIVISEDAIGSLSDEELQEYILEEIQLVCS